MIIPQSKYNEEDSTVRQIYKDEHNFNRYFAKINFYDKEIVKDADVSKTVYTMMAVVSQFYQQAKKISQVLKVTKNNKIDVENTCRNIFNFVQRYIKYKLERGEILRTPNATWYYGQVAYWKNPDLQINSADCDCMSIFCASVLKCLGIDFGFKITSYTGKCEFQHVYTIAYDGNKQIIIDPVYHYFNEEKTPIIDSRFFRFQETTMNGVNIRLLGSLGKAKNKAEKKAKRKEKRARHKKKRRAFFKKVGGVFKKVAPTLVVSRGAFLAILAMNFRGFATRLSLDDIAREKMLKFWEKMGGKRSNLEKRIKNAASRKALFGRSKKLKRLQQAKMNGLGAISNVDLIRLEAQEILEGVISSPDLGWEPVSTSAGACATAATPFITKAMTFLKDSGIIDKLLDKGGEVAQELIEKGITKKSISNEDVDEDFSEDFDDDQMIEFEQDGEDSEDLEDDTMSGIDLS